MPVEVVFGTFLIVAERIKNSRRLLHHRKFLRAKRKIEEKEEEEEEERKRNLSLSLLLVSMK